MGFYEVNMRQNFSGAAAYFKRAADKGDRDGLSNLAVSYDNGWVKGHPPDKVYMYQSAASLPPPGGQPQGPREIWPKFVTRLFPRV